MSNKPIKILLVEDDDSLGFMLKDNLGEKGWKVKLCEDGAKALTAFHNDEYDLCIFDVMLPLLDGFSLAKKIRKINTQVPIIFLTARNMAEDRLKGFEIGADDYVTKPFSIDELKYRIEAILKRTYGVKSSSDEKDVLHVGNTILDVNNHLLKFDDQTIKLTHKEAKIIRLFFSYPDKVIERETFLKTVWQNDGFFVARSMDVFISKIRKYIKPDVSLTIENVHGIGYVLNVKN